MSARDVYLSGGQSYDTRMTGEALERVANLLDLADNQVKSRVYPELAGSLDLQEIALAWCWAAVLLADVADIDSVTIRSLANAIKGIYVE